MKKIIIIINILCAGLVAFANPELKQLTLNDVIGNRIFSQKSIYGLRSMNDGIHYTQIDKGTNLAKYDYTKGKFVENIVAFSSLPVKKRVENYEFSDDESKILLATNSEYIYRRSFTADYYVYDLASKTCKLLSENGKQKVAAFSPDGNSVAFVRNNNIFIKNLLSGTETQITNDGEHNKIINGHTDWVYEEEYGFTRAFEWSPDSKKLAYYRFDESKVKEYNMNVFEGNLYPENQTFKYPKAGENNSIVSIFVYDLNSTKSVHIDVGDESNQYIARIKWNNNNLAVIRLNRLQNHLDILMADVETGKTKSIYTDIEKCYVERVTDEFLTFLNDGSEFIVINEKDGFKHLYRYKIDGTFINQITKGNWDVTGFLGCDEKIKTAYFISCESSPLQSDLYSIKLDGTNKKKISLNNGTNIAVFSKGFKYFINFYSNSETPLVITLHLANGKQLRVLENNSELRGKMKEYDIPQRRFFKFKTSDSIELNGYIIKPNNFNENKKYPVLMTQYSGPGSQQVKNSFKIDWEEVLASGGIIVVCVDGRGTGGRGEEFRKITYGQLGKYELIDQVETAKYLAKLPYVDAKRIGIWGWSFGGFMALNCILKANDIFKLAIAVAPVTNWRFYDSIYTELYNGLPQENPHGYDDNSPINFAEKLRGKLLIIHGTADDNVHIQNSYEMIAKLISKNKQFDMMVYPDKNHSIYGGLTRLQLFTKKMNYILENL